MDTYCPFCKQEYETEEKYLGMSIECSFCGKKFVIQKVAEQHADEESNSTVTDKEDDKMKEYKVLSQKDTWFAQKFDPASLEKALNGYASQGWRVVSAVTATFPGFIGGERDEMIIIMERDK